ncbi:MAG: pyridoxine 5'-phosphate synthase [Alphaproteobacteria bacterium]|nr:pyridoxine 5'-phosphate synthase [Alphaproteobacteria bacterium SS10]
MTEPLRLGVNIDHVATIRNARGGNHPEPVRAASAAVAAGADGITIHLREDRRHIRDADVPAIIQEVDVPVNLEIAATDEMRAIAADNLPRAVCIVPERREEVTTEGGLNVLADEQRLKEFIVPLSMAGIRVSLFIDPEPAQVEASARVGAGAIELHTGAYAGAFHDEAQRNLELARLIKAAASTKGTGMECHAGHGLTFENVGLVAKIPEVVELNIGHFLVGEAVFTGLQPAIQRMRSLMDAARREVLQVAT